MANKKEIIWMERLTVMDCIFMSVKSMICGCEVNYDEYKSSRISLKILRSFQNMKFCLNFHPAGLKMEIKDADGHALMYRMLDSLNSAIDGFIANKLHSKNEYFKKNLKCFIANLLYPGFSFIAMASAKAGCGAGRQNIFYTARRPFGFILIEHFRAKGLMVRPGFDYGEVLKYFLRPFKHLLLVLLPGVKPGKAKNKPEIWVEYTFNDVCDFGFWKDYVKPDTFTVFYYIDTSAVPASFACVESAGVRVLDIRKINFNPGIRKMVRIVFESMAGNAPVSIKVFNLESEFLFESFKTLFQKHNVKLLVQYQDTSWKQGVQSKAIEAVGGIMLGMHWSSFVTSELPNHLFSEHVFFVWGEAIKPYISGKTNPYCTILPSGQWMTIDEKVVADTRNRLKNRGFTVTIFDSSAAYNIHQSPQSLVEFYSAMIGLLEDNAAWAGIIKSKNWDIRGLFSLPGGDRLVSRIKPLISDGRVIFLDKVVSPVTAAACSDLCICYGLNSAGIIAASHGFRTIHWDCSGWLRHPLYRYAKDSIVFTSLDGLKNAVLRASCGDSGVGDFNRWAKGYNYFNDFNAPKRIGEFIQDFMDGLGSSVDQMQARDNAVKNYITRNGLPWDFFTGDNDQERMTDAFYNRV